MFEKIIHQDLENIYKNKIINWKQLNFKKYLITGSNGFLVSYLIYLLIYLNVNKGYKIKIFLMTRNKSKVKKKFINIKTKKFITILDDQIDKKIKFSQKVDYIFHAASNASPKNYSKFPIDTLLPNSVGTYNLLEYANRKKIKSFILFSSGEVYGNTKNKILKEEVIFDFNHLSLKASYLEGKKIAETTCYSFFKQRKIPIKILRVFHTYGPMMNLNDGRVMMDFTKNIIQNKDISVKGYGNQKRTFCYISDFIVGLIIVLLKGKNGEAYNIGNNKEFYSIKKLAKALIKFTNKKKIVFRKRNKKDNYLVSSFNSVYPSIDKIKKLGFRPYINIHKGFKNTIDFYKDLKKVKKHFL